MNYSITKNGKELDETLYTIDEENKTFATKEDHLVLDFDNQSGWSFETEHSCVFKTGRDCKFSTGSHCTFETGSYCTFATSSDCIFKTDKCCTLLGYCGGKRYRYFLDKSRYVFTKHQLLEINDENLVKNREILNSKFEDELVRNLCEDILK